MDSIEYKDKLSQCIALMTEEKYTEAKKQLEELVKVNPKEVELYKHLGNACANLRLLDESLEYFKKILLLDAKNGEALFSIGSVYILKENNVKAIEYFNKAEACDYKTPQMYMLMATIFLEESDEIQSIRNINKAIELAPLDGELRLYKVRIYLANGKFDLALESLDEMERLLPDAFEVYAIKAQIFVGQERNSEALDIISRGCERFPNDANLASLKLRVLVELGMIKEADEHLVLMKEKGLYELTLKDSAMQEATLCIKNNKINDAIDVLKKANDALDNDADILFVLIDILAKREKYDELLGYSELLTSLDCSNLYKATSSFFHATALSKVNRFEEAKKEFENVVVTTRRMTIDDPSFYEGYIFRLLAHVELKQFDKALEMANYLENLNPEKADSHAFKYHIYKEMGDEISAEQEKKKVKSMDSNFAI